MSILYLRNPVFIKPCFAVNGTLVLFMMNYSQFCAEPYFVSLCPTTPILEAVSSVKEFGAFFSDETISLLTFNPFSLFISALLSGYLASYISFLRFNCQTI